MKQHLLFLFSLPFIAFFVNMLLVAFLGRDLAIEINGGRNALLTFYYSNIALVVLYVLLQIKKKFKRKK